MLLKYSSSLLETAVNEFAKLPGIGRKTALRLVLNLLKRTPEEVEKFGRAVVSLRREVHYCQICHNISDDTVCHICGDLSRDKSLVCVVENIRDVMAIENTGQFNGLYHVLGGILSPMNGVGPGDLQVDSLVSRVECENVREIILALSTTMEGDTTNYYIYRRLANKAIKLSIIARGISVGDEIEYADEITLGSSIVNRVNFSDTLKL